MTSDGLRRPVLLGLWASPLILIAATALILAWAHDADTRVAADEPHPGLDFSLRIDDCIGGAVDTKGGDAQCDIGIGSTFTAAVDLNTVPGDIGLYAAFDASLAYSGVASKDDVSITWPDCVFPGIGYGAADMLFGCVIGVMAPYSTYTGELGTNDFNCTAGESSGNTVTLVHGVASGDTNLTDSVGTQHAEAGTETLTVNCISAPPTATPCPDNDGDTLCDGVDPDDDNDGCTDVAEQGPNPNQGGQRNPYYFWDYGDMPDPNADPERDLMIRVPDIVRVLNRYGEDDEDGTAPINRNSDPLSTPPKTGYHPAYDRGDYVGPNPWNLEPPNGTIRVPDIVFVLNQYGHDCN